MGDIIVFCLTIAVIVRCFIVYYRDQEPIQAPRKKRVTVKSYQRTVAA